MIRHIFYLIAVQNSPVFPLKHLPLSISLTIRSPVSVGKLMELHGEGSTKTVTTESGEKVDRPDNYEPPVLDNV